MFVELYCPEASTVERSQILERYNVISGFTSYACDVNHVFPAGGTARAVVCRSGGQWSQAVEPCTGQTMPLRFHCNLGSTLV